MREIAWKSSTLFPRYGRKGWSILKNEKMVDNLSEIEVKQRVESWLPTNPLLVGAPSADTYVPPSAVASLQDGVIAISRKNSLNYTIAFSACSVFLLIFGVLNNADTIFAYSVACFLLATGFLVNFIYSNRPGVLTEKAQFFYWLKTSMKAKYSALSWTVFISLVGAFQLILMYYYGSVHNIIKDFGVYYPAVRSGQSWRLLIGPFFHYSLLLFMINALLLIFAGWVCSIFNTAFVISLFLLGNVIGAYAQMSFGGQLFNNYAGISPGIFCLLTVFVSYGFFKRGVLPKGMGIYFAFIFSSALVSTAYLQHTATVSHIAGSLLGLLGAAVYSILQRVRRLTE